MKSFCIALVLCALSGIALALDPPNVQTYDSGVGWARVQINPALVGYAYKLRATSADGLTTKSSGWVSTPRPNSLTVTASNLPAKAQSWALSIRYGDGQSTKSTDAFATVTTLDALIFVIPNVAVDPVLTLYSEEMTSRGLSTAQSNKATAALRRAAVRYQAALDAARLAGIDAQAVSDKAKILEEGNIGD